MPSDWACRRVPVRTIAGKNIFMLLLDLFEQLLQVGGWDERELHLRDAFFSRFYCFTVAFHRFPQGTILHQRPRLCRCESASKIFSRRHADPGSTLLVESHILLELRIAVGRPYQC